MKERPLRVGKMQCPECLGEVSSEATACLHCGHTFSPEHLASQASFEAQEQKFARKTGIAVALLFALGLGTCVFSGSGSNTSNNGGLKTDAAVGNNTGVILPPSDRFTEFPASHPLRSAQEALNAGNPLKAGQLYFDRRPSDDDERTARFKVALDTAWNDQTGTDPAADFVDRIKTFWTPETEALSSISPDSDGIAYKKQLGEFDRLGSSLSDGDDLALNNEQAASYRTIRSALSQQQRKLFPAMRREYRATLAPDLFRGDVDVSVAGANADTIRFTGPAFVRNANIDDFQKMIRPFLQKLRFKRVEYQWSSRHEEGHRYKLDTPADGDVGFWDNRTFEKVGG